ncbi:hypothetical protein IFM89_013519 [Coptis chinensis]|uniref:TFIIS N-terminal domain-containing protein n=1 Tax=Coptis chinensis TaxID=261450 RepID=A0A835H638_9MAGN|nr:hypothetical protein IFM89_013519 [Coptis chinensis]
MDNGEDNPYRDKDIEPLMMDLDDMSLDRDTDKIVTSLVKKICTTNQGRPVPLLNSKSKTKEPGLYEKTSAKMNLVLEKFMERLRVATEEDAELHKQSKPGVNKLEKLPLLKRVLSDRLLQPKLLDFGVLNVLKNWLKPDFQIDVEEHERREQQKKSGLTRVVKFLSISNKETLANQELARNLVHKWSRLPKFTVDLRAKVTQCDSGFIVRQLNKELHRAKQRLRMR